MPLPSYDEYLQSFQKKKEEQDAQFEALGYKRVGNKYLKVNTPTEDLKEQIGLKKSALDLEKAEKDLAGDSDLEGLLTPTEAGVLGVAYGTKRKEAVGKTPMTTEERNKQLQSKKAMSVLSQIEKYSKDVNNFDAGKGGTTRAAKGLLNWIGAKTQTNKSAAMLESQKGKLSNLIRSLGEVGALAEGDVQRGIALMPTIFDTKDVASQKLADLKELLESNIKAAPTVDPLGLR